LKQPHQNARLGGPARDLCTELALDGSALRSWPPEEPEIERREHQDNPDVYRQPLPEVVLEEQDVHAHHDGHHREHVKHGGCLSSHRFLLLCATERSKRGAGLSETFALAEPFDDLFSRRALARLRMPRCRLPGVGAAG
jgi:hypothetical protein